MTLDEVDATCGRAAVEAMGKMTMGGATSWDQALARRPWAPTALADVIDGHAERTLGYGPLWARRSLRPQVSHTRTYQRHDHDPAERFPALQYLLPWHEAELVVDGGRARGLGSVGSSRLDRGGGRQRTLLRSGGRTPWRGVRRAWLRPLWLVNSAHAPERAWLYLERAAPATMHG